MFSSLVNVIAPIMTRKGGERGDKLYSIPLCMLQIMEGE